jgi:N-acetylmuramoyl-L-alanine amidase
MKKIVYLDPGHGGHDPGALGPSGVKESDMALDVCIRAKRMLSPYVDCRLTRSTDVFLSLSTRPAKANNDNADLFISYHFNSASGPAKGFEIFTTPGQNYSDNLATILFKKQGELFPDQKQRADTADGDPDKEASFAVIRGTKCPSCLMEGEFIHTLEGEAFIVDPLNREKMAEVIMRGVLEYLEISKGANFTKPVIDTESQLNIEQRVARLESIVL